MYGRSAFYPLFIVLNQYSQFSSYPQYFIKELFHLHKKAAEIFSIPTAIHPLYNEFPFVNVSVSSTNLP